ncbi:hypothetical protein LIS82_27020 (plasmid) [Cytobacillus solani]|uniref:hypothetical protein n=1 Tax=Cytobacillus solani TaxID=1637975 RepID=UPI002079EC19|nr:hypothetical protein [Cytobacillus solani]USK57866.1 hypothetical protein LIS82_27020 [Cytobacillus solani]
MVENAFNIFVYALPSQNYGKLKYESKLTLIMSLIAVSQPVIDKIIVGKPQTFGNKDAKHPMDREWTNGIVKYSVKGKIWAGKTNLGGDG